MGWLTVEEGPMGRGSEHPQDAVGSQNLWEEESLVSRIPQSELQGDESQRHL